MEQSASEIPDQNLEMSPEDRRRLFDERLAKALAELRTDLGPLSVTPSNSPAGLQARAELQNLPVRPYAILSPNSQNLVQNYGVAYGNMSPEGGYELVYSLDPETKRPVVSGAYRRVLDKNSEIAAQGSYAPMPGGDAYRAMLQYRQRFADGGDVQDPLSMAQAAQTTQEPDVIRARDIEAPATRSAQAMNAYMQAAVPDLQVINDPRLAENGRRGQVELMNPNRIVMSPSEKGMSREATLLHEMEHSLMGKAVMGAPPKEQIDNDIRFDNLYGDAGYTRMRIVQNMVKNKDKIEKFFGVPIPDVYFEKAMYDRQSRRGSAAALFEEQIATLSALEQLTNKSLTKGMPDLFPDDKSAAIYDALTGLRQTRLDARDLPPHTPQYRTGLDWIKEKLRMRADGSPPEGEVADPMQQMITGTPPTDQEPGFMGQGIRAAGQQLYENFRQAIQEPKEFHRRALGNLKESFERDPVEWAMNWTGGGVGGIIRPKGGGNLLSGEVERAIQPLRPKIEAPNAKEFASDYYSKIKSDKDAWFSADEMPAIGGGGTQHQVYQRIEREAALDDWIKNKFGNYVKKQMGTEDDPIRKLADEMSEKVQANYQAGLKRIAKMKDDIAKAKAKGKNTDVSEAELADEIDRVEEAFQSASILPDQLPPYNHPTVREGAAREKAGFSAFPVAKSMQGKAYEEIADVPFVPMTKKELVDFDWFTAGPGYKEANQEWVSKLKDEDILYRIRSEDLNEKQIFTHTIDELRNALNPNSGLPPQLQLKPEDMQGLGIEKAFRHVNNINDWRMQQRVQANLDEAKRSAVTVKEYPETRKKLQWQQLKPMEYTELPPGYNIGPSQYGPALYGPDGQRMITIDPDVAEDPLRQALNFLSKNDLEKALQYEGSTMRHCVGGYCDDVWSKETEIYSLRDKKGEPHVTIETAPLKGANYMWFWDSLTDAQREAFKPTIDTLSTDIRKAVQNMPNVAQYGQDAVENVTWKKAIESLPEYKQWVESRPAEILQIKGKGNGKPKEDYIPFIQDFIKSREWSKIGDYKNANMNHINPEGNFAADLKRAGYDIPEYVNNEQYEKLKEIRARLLRMSSTEFNASRPPPGQTIGLDQLQ